MKQHFRLFNTMMGDHVATLEMSEELLTPEADILHYESMTLRGIKGGGVYTLIPIDDHTVLTLKKVHSVYKEVTETPAKHFSTHLGRIDHLIEAVGLLFGSVEYTLVESKSDLEKIINPNMDRDWEAKKVKYNILDAMMTEALAKSGGEAPVEHVHGPDCKH